jgi:hydroxymethylpyrimidine pyrophosphatase-like HAD family hydrolase
MDNHGLGENRMTIPAIIVDVDGTLATFEPEQVRPWVLGDQKHWQPFFLHMENAPAIEPVVKLVRLLKAQGQAILICSGRPDSYRDETLGWIDRNQIPYDQAYLRPDGQDHVADETVKERLLQKMWADNYAPWLVLDDRDAVVRQWRRMGLTCLQCASGDF